ncbi:uncharacterized protein G6M90_00g041550 [Metarhizium brunneum]|uniref:Uncharacterized protein n=1 Tax=Metarhizium brunneum TaxID=500148 RepID=A0A7D5Z1N7_9HYPO|nr:hypothetical protein G6M90_00g041550 [Metarhizium brunneum]
MPADASPAAADRRVLPDSVPNITELLSILIYGEYPDAAAGK